MQLTIFQAPVLVRKLLVTLVMISLTCCASSSGGVDAATARSPATANEPPNQSYCEPTSVSLPIPSGEVRSPATLLEAIANAKFALDHCYFIRDGFIADSILETYFGGQSVYRHPPGPGYTGATTLGIFKTATSYAAGRFEVTRFEKPMPGDPPGLRAGALASSLEPFGLRIGDLTSMLGSKFEWHNRYADPAYTQGHGWPVPPKTDPLGNAEIEFEYDNNSTITSKVRVLMSGDGVVQTIIFLQRKN